MSGRARPDDIRTELILLLSDEFAAAGLDNTVVHPEALEGGGRSPAQMVITLDADAFGRAPLLHVYFLPELAEPAVIQYMVFFDGEVRPDSVADLGRFIALLNSNLTITGFEFSEELRQLVFRHTHAAGTAPLDPGVVAWTVAMVRYAVETYGSLVGFVAHGGSLERATALLAAGLAQLTNG